MIKNTQTYIALLRGINVGGHHKVPMAELRREMEAMNFSKVQTLLNSGNVIFAGPPEPEAQLEAKLEERLAQTFGFPIPVMVRSAENIRALLAKNPFAQITVTKDIRLYVSFLKEQPEVKLSLPWATEDESFRILAIDGRTICSVLDLSKANTPKGMDALEKLFGKDITTRNWNTLLRIDKKLKE